MLAETREVIDVASSNISHSAPNTPITKHTKTFLDQTPIPKVESPKWKAGVPTPTNDGVLTPNQEALNLLTGFATGSIRMKDDVVQHLPAVQGNTSIGESLQELPWYSPNQTKKIDGSVNCSKKAKLVEKKPKKKLALQTIAGQLAEQYPCKCISDSEIKPENIILGSPEYIPYKHLKYGGKGIKIVKTSTNTSAGMPRRKQTPTKVQKAKA